MHRIFSKGCNFIYTQREMKQRPNISLPEVAFVGRSNVGKSSLINALVYSKKLVRSAKTPGSTISINYFNLAGMLLLVDLPGFGYAKQSKAKVKNVSVLIEDYLFNDNKLSLLILIIDVRRGLNEFSLDLIESLSKESIDVLIVLSKIDKVTEKVCNNVAEEIKQDLSKTRSFKGIFPISNTKKIGLENLREFITKHCLKNE
jgi:GTP-binding protein